MKNFIENITVEDARNEINQMIEDEYRYGFTLDHNRLRDLYYTISVLEAK